MTGSTGGIGRATAALLVEPRVRAWSRAAAARRPVSARPGTSPPISRSLASRSASVAEAGELDVLVNNVGYAEQRDFLAVTDEQWDEVWQLNVMSYVRAIRAAVPGMRSAAAA